MPRRGRIRLVGKWDARDREALAEDLLGLAGELHQPWREQQSALQDDLSAEGEPLSQKFADGAGVSQSLGVAIEDACL